MQPFYEQAVSDLGPWRSVHRPVKVAHSLFIEGSHMTKNTASGAYHCGNFTMRVGSLPDLQELDLDGKNFHR